MELATQATTVRLNDEMYERLRREAFETRKSQADIIRQALAEHYERLDAEAAAGVGTS